MHARSLKKIAEISYDAHCDFKNTVFCFLVPFPITIRDISYVCVIQKTLISKHHKMKKSLPPLVCKMLKILLN